VSANVPVCLLQSVNERESDALARLCDVVRDGLVDVTVGLLARDNRLDGHRRRPVV
jgi:hypothetical protein